MIDWTRVLELREEIGADDFSEVVELFLSEVEERLEDLKARTEIAKIEDDLHFLKGSALNLGFQDFAALCHDGESRASNGDTTLDSHVIQLTYQNSKTMFLERLEGGLSN